MYCIRCGASYHSGDNFCTRCGSALTGNIVPSGANPTDVIDPVDPQLLRELTRHGLSEEKARWRLRVMKLASSKSLRASYSDVTIERKFAGDGANYFGWSSSRRTPSMPEGPLKYGASLIQVTNKRIIFWEGDGDSMDLLTSKSAILRTPDHDRLTFEGIRVYLSPYWVLDPGLSDELARQFNDFYQRLGTPNQSLRESSKLLDRLKSKAANFVFKLEVAHGGIATLGARRALEEGQRRSGREWTWVREATAAAKGSYVEVELLHV